MLGRDRARARGRTGRRATGASPPRGPSPAPRHPRLAGRGRRGPETGPECPWRADRGRAVIGSHLDAAPASPARTRPEEKRALVSIVIATYGREGLLCDTLRHLLAADL